MQEERKSMGGALVDVFDAGVTLVKTEIRALLRQVGDVAKAKGIGVVLLLASVGPLLLGLVFLILAVFYGLIRLGLGAWAAALLIALVGFAMTGALILLGLRRLSTEVPREDTRPARRSGPMTEDERLEAEYQAEQAAKAKGQGGSASTPAPAATAQARTTVNLSSGQATSQFPAQTSAQTGAASSGAASDRSVPTTPPRRVSTTGELAAGTRDTPDQQDNMRSSGLPDTGTRGNAIQRQMEEDRQRNVSRPGLSTSGFTSGEGGVNASDRGEGIKTPLTEQQAVSQGTEMRGTDGGEVRLPVYEATESGEAQVYGSGLNKKIDGTETHDAGADGHGGHDDKHDPNIQHPVVLKDAPGISVSTKPTFQDDMKKEGY